MDTQRRHSTSKIDKGQDVYHIEDVTPKMSADKGVTEEMRVSEAYMAHEPIIDPPVTRRCFFSTEWREKDLLTLQVDDQGSHVVSGSYGVSVDWLSDSSVFVRRGSSIQSVFWSLFQYKLLIFVVYG